MIVMASHTANVAVFIGGSNPDAGSDIDNDVLGHRESNIKPWCPREKSQTDIASFPKCGRCLV